MCVPLKVLIVMAYAVSIQGIYVKLELKISSGMLLCPVDIQSGTQGVPTVRYVIEFQRLHVLSMTFEAVPAS